MNLKEIVNWRYSTKVFNTEKKISKEDFDQLKSILQMSPSSTNLQPWHFIIADSKAGKERIAKGTQGFFHFNTPKVLDASHVIVFASRITADEDFLEELLEQEDKDGRYAKPEFKADMDKGRKLFVNIHKNDLKDETHWMDKQTYLNMGMLLLGAAALGIDVVPMEGVDTKALDEEFGLNEKGYATLAVLALGYRGEGDFNAELPKSRLPQNEIFNFLK